MFLPRIEGDKWLVNLIAILDAVYPTWARLSNQPRRVSWAERVNLALAAKKRQISDQAGRDPGNVGPSRFCHNGFGSRRRRKPSGKTVNLVALCALPIDSLLWQNPPTR